MNEVGTSERASDASGGSAGSSETSAPDPSAVRDVHVVGAVILGTHTGAARCLAAQRRPGGAEGLRWEFPGGKVEPGESAEAALRREIEEELGVVIQVGEHLGRGTALHGARCIVLDLYAATLDSGELERREHEALRWIGPGEVDGFDWATADRFVLARVKQLLGS